MWLVAVVGCCVAGCDHYVIMNFFTLKSVLIHCIMQFVLQFGIKC
jgi:hypothetical protein